MVLVSAYALANLLKLGMITTLLGLMFQYGAIALLIVFHPELRAALAHLGRTRRLFAQMGNREVATEVSRSMERLSRLGSEAIERHRPACGSTSTARVRMEMQARVSADLLVTIFTPHSPLGHGP